MVEKRVMYHYYFKGSPCRVPTERERINCQSTMATFRSKLLLLYPEIIPKEDLEEGMGLIIWLGEESASKTYHCQIVPINYRIT